MTETNSLDEIRQLTHQAEKILILIHRKPDGDAIGSALALYFALQKIGKSATLVCEDEIPEMYDFLSGTKQFQKSLAGGRDFVITLDCTEGEISKLKYNHDGEKMNIVIAPESGNFRPEHVSFSYGPSNYDLIFVLDCGDLQQLGSLYENNVDLFYAVPVINIDHHASNTAFGKVNYVDPAASSTAEIMPQVLRGIQKDEDVMDSEIATLLLTGIITDTGSFQNPNTSPNSFDIAADLLEEGARQQEIIRHIYKTKRLSTLKLWGKILSKIRYDEKYRIVWSSISAEDLSESGATPEESGGIIDELLTNAPKAEVVLLFKEYDNVISGSIRTTSPTVDATKIAKIFGGGGHTQAAGFKIPNKDLATVEQEVIQAIRKFQTDRLGLSNETYTEELKENEEVEIKKEANPPSNEASTNKEEKKLEPIEKEVPSVSLGQGIEPALTESLTEKGRDQKIQEED